MTVVQLNPYLWPRELHVFDLWECLKRVTGWCRGWEHRERGGTVCTRWEEYLLGDTRSFTLSAAVLWPRLPVRVHLEQHQCAPDAQQGCTLSAWLPCGTPVCHTGEPTCCKKDFWGLRAKAKSDWFSFSLCKMCRNNLNMAYSLLIEVAVWILIQVRNSCVVVCVFIVLLFSRQYWYPWKMPVSLCDSRCLWYF